MHHSKTIEPIREAWGTTVVYSQEDQLFAGEEEAEDFHDLDKFVVTRLYNYQSENKPSPEKQGKICEKQYVIWKQVKI